MIPNLSDRCAELAGKAQFCLALLGNIETQDYQCVMLEGKALSQDMRKDLTGRGLAFLGVVAIVDSKFQVALEDAFPESILLALWAEFNSAMELEISFLEKLGTVCSSMTAAQRAYLN